MLYLICSHSVESSVLLQMSSPAASNSNSSLQCQVHAEPAKVFVFGANGLLGLEMVSALTSAQYAKHFPQVSAVIRAETLNSKDPKKAAAIQRLRASGATLISGDTEKASASDIASWLSGHDIVISVIGFFSPGASIEHKLLSAVQQAGVSWYIPAIFGFDVYRMHSAPTPFMAEKRVVIDAVKAAKGLNTFVFNNGIFLEYLIAADGQPSFAGVDIGNSTVTAPYSFDVRLSTTSVVDIARLTAEALVQRELPHVKNQILWVSADSVSFGEVHSLLEQHFHKKFAKKIVSKEEAHALVAADVKHEDGVNRFKVAWAESVPDSIAWPVANTFNAKYAPNVKLTTVKERLQQLYPQA